MGMEMMGIPQIPRDGGGCYFGDGNKSRGNPVGIDRKTAGFSRECTVTWCLSCTSNSEIRLQVSSRVQTQNTAREREEDAPSHWSGRVVTWSQLAQVASSVLVMPATNLSSAWCYFSAERTVDGRQKQRSAESVDRLLFLHGLKH